MPDTLSLKELDIRIRTLENSNASGVTEIKGIRESLERLEGMVSTLMTKIEANYVTKDQLALFTKDQKYGKIVGGLIGALITIVILGVVGFFLPEIKS